MTTATFRKGDAVIVRDDSHEHNGRRATYVGTDRATRLKIVSIDGGQFGVAAIEPAPRTVVRTTEPKARRLQPRTVEIVTGTRVNRHHNDDGSITLYANGLKIHRTASDEDIENGLVAEDYDADEAIDKFLRRWFGHRPWLFGKTTHGHNWKTTKARREAAKAAAEADTQSSEKEG